MITQKQTLQIIHDLLLTIINIKEKTMFAENICKSCGKELIPEQDFCSDCGTKIKKTETELYIEKLEKELAATKKELAATKKELAATKKELCTSRYLCWFGFINQTTEDLTITWKVNDDSIVKKN
jgi:predicted amidophosphoribosyltransferase